MKETKQLKGGLMRMRAITLLAIAFLVTGLFAPLVAASVDADTRVLADVPHKAISVREIALTASHGSPSRESVTAAELKEETGFDISSELESFSASSEGSEGRGFLIVSITFGGPEVKGVLLEKKIATAVMASDKRTEVNTMSSYKGRINIKGDTYALSGNDISALDLHKKTFAVTPGTDRAQVSEVVGIVSFDFEAEKVSVMLDGETSSYKLTDFERKPLRKAVEVLPDDNIMEDIPIWKRFFAAFRGDSQDGSTETSKVRERPATQAREADIRVNFRSGEDIEMPTELVPEEGTVPENEAEKSESRIQAEREPVSVLEWFKRVFSGKDTTALTRTIVVSD